jgi:hypothetical protein
LGATSCPSAMIRSGPAGTISSGPSFLTLPIATRDRVDLAQRYNKPRRGRRSSRGGARRIAGAAMREARSRSAESRCQWTRAQLTEDFCPARARSSAATESSSCSSAWSIVRAMGSSIKSSCSRSRVALAENLVAFITSPKVLKPRVTPSDEPARIFSSPLSARRGRTIQRAVCLARIRQRRTSLVPRG